MDKSGDDSGAGYAGEDDDWNDLVWKGHLGRLSLEVEE